MPITPCPAAPPAIVPLERRVRSRLRREVPPAVIAAELHIPLQIVERQSLLMRIAKPRPRPAPAPRQDRRHESEKDLCDLLAGQPRRGARDLAPQDFV